MHLTFIEVWSGNFADKKYDLIPSNLSSLHATHQVGDSYQDLDTESGDLECNGLLWEAS